MKNVSELTANLKEYFQTHFKKITKDDVKKLASKPKQDFDKLFSNEKLNAHIDDLNTMVEVVQDYDLGKYDAISYDSILAITFTLIYLYNPLDLVPDFIPVIGLLEDVAMVKLCVDEVSADLDKYREWKKTNTEQTPNPA